MQNKSLKDLGLNAYVTKPFDPDYLYSQILKFAGNNSVNKLPNPNTIPAPAKPGQTLIKNGYLNKLMEFTKGNETFAREIVQVSIRGLQEFNNIVPKAILDQDRDKILFHSHKLKSTISMLGLHDLASQIKAIKGINLQDLSKEKRIELSEQFQAGAKSIIDDLEKIAN
jgi:hypothetical protein